MPSIGLPSLHAAQIAIVDDPCRFKVCACGRRFGKGVLGIGECVRLASQGKRCWWLCPSFASAAYQAGWRALEFYAANIKRTELALQRRMLQFPGGGWVQFKTSEEPDSLRGESIDFVVVDEAAHVPQLKAIWELCLRPTLLDRKGQAWFISTPNGFNYFNELFTRGRASAPGWAAFQFPSNANPHLDKDELAELCKDMPALIKRQEIDAEFVQLAGAMFQREWIVRLDQEPAYVKTVRCWDLAYTTKTSSDYTAGAKVGLTADGCVVVSHIVHGRWEWGDALSRVAATAKVDGPNVVQHIEIVGAQRGFLDDLKHNPQLMGIPLTGASVHKDKLTRALPVLARAEQRKLAVVNGGWDVTGFIDELCSFPEGAHDDRVDCLSAAVSALAEVGVGAYLI